MALEGIVCSVVTPFDADGEPDVAALCALLDAQIACGVHGLFVLGTAGEGLLLPAETRQWVLEEAVAHVAGRVPVVAHCGAPDTGTAVALAAHAEAAGCAAAATVAPYFFRYEAPALYRHFAAIAEAAPGLDHYVYENPERVGYAVGSELIGRLVNEVGPIVGVKDTGDSIGRLTLHLIQPGRPPAVFVGSNTLVFPGLVVGAKGAVSALANAAPELLVRLYDAWQAGDLGEARSLQLLVARLEHAIRGMPYLGAIKYLVRRRGLPAGRLRAPQADVEPGQAAQIDRVADPLGPRPDLR
jgi:dihydrodipicolinate synthase/N-acetylneuraminate lyase